MSTRKPFILLSIMISGLLLLSACGNDDASTASAPAPAATPMAESSAPAPSEDGMGLSMDNIEKAEGVVYQDEIYANWPYN
jgi:hypothetical protein